MADKNVYLYQTQSLYDRLDKEGDPQKALDRAKTYIEGAFGRINLTVDVQIESQTPDPPQEGYKNVTGSAPCQNICSSWDWLNGWFRDWLDCNDLQQGHEAHDDVSFLLSDTDASDGGLSFPKCAHAQTGYWVSQLPSSYENNGSGKAFSAMETVLHELGHSFTEQTSTEFDHNSGTTSRTSSSSTEFQRTVMGFIKGKDANECSAPHYYETGTSIGPDDVLYRMIWSDCCLAEWNPYAYQL